MKVANAMKFKLECYFIGKKTHPAVQKVLNTLDISATSLKKLMKKDKVTLEVSKPVLVE